MRGRSRLIAAMIAAVMVVVFFAAAESQAFLGAVSANDPINGFPIAYTDATGLSLFLCKDPAHCVVTPPIVGNAFSQTIGFGAEMFYFIADSDKLTVGPQVAGGVTDVTLVRLALEAAFGSVPGVDPVAVRGDPAPGTQITFARINMKGINSGPNCPAVPTDCTLQPGATYTVTHPWGTFTFTADAAGDALSGPPNGQAFRAQDGCVAPPFPCNFAAIVGPAGTPKTNATFLTAVAPAPPPGFIGAPLVLQTVTGGLNNNAMTITGPNIGGPGVNTLTTNLWNLAGQRASRFQDVPFTHPFFSFIDAVAAAGITGGCSAAPPLFCPDASITRAQMAVFLLASLGVTPALCTGTRFSDVSPLTVGQTFCNYIEELAARGITAGCGGGLYCPGNPVTRAEMAVFVERALGVAAPPACNGLRFGDVNATVMPAAFCGFIEDFALRGITGGCAVGPPPLFCPSDLVTRGQMAVFLVTAPAPLLP